MINDRSGKPFFAICKLTAIYAIVSDIFPIHRVLNNNKLLPINYLPVLCTSDNVHCACDNELEAAKR